MKKAKIDWFTIIVRDELNWRLRQEEPDEEILEWINGEPEVKETVKRRFGGVPVGARDLEEWRRTGFRVYQVRGELSGQAYELSKLGEVLDLPKLADNLVGAVAAHFAGLLISWNGEPDAKFDKKVGVLRGLAKDVAVIHRCVCQSTRLKQQGKKKRKTEEAGGSGGADLMGMFREIVQRRQEAEAESGHRLTQMDADGAGKTGEAERRVDREIREPGEKGGRGI